MELFISELAKLKMADMAAWALRAGRADMAERAERAGRAEMAEMAERAERARLIVIADEDAEEVARHFSSLFLQINICTLMYLQIKF